MSENINRRDFLKLSSATAAFTGVSCMAGTLGSLGEQVITGKGHFIGSYCEVCSSRCPISAKIVDKKNTFIKGNSKAELTGDSVCARGGSGHSQLYDKQRLVKPLIRVGDRGEDKWKTVSWEEALNHVASKLAEIKEKNGAKSVVFSSKTGEHYHHMRTFANVFGAQNVFSHVSTCPITYKIAFPHTYGTGLKRDFARSKYILNFGHNLFEGIDIKLTKPFAKAANSDKTKLVVLDPRFSIVASKADQWFPVKPGTDLAFILAVTHVCLRDGLYDKEFAEKYTVGIEKLIESTQKTTPSWQKKYTGIAPSEVEKVAKELYAAAPHCIIDWGHKTTTGKSEYQRTRAILVLNALMGNLEQEGGLYFAKKAKTINKIVDMNLIPTLTNPDSHIKAHKKNRIDKAGEEGANKFVSYKHGSLTDLPDAILNKDPYEIKAWFMIRTNPLQTLADVKKTTQAIKALDFVVVSDVYMSETAMLADVVLPEATYLERDEGVSEHSTLSPSYKIRNKVVEPINQTLSSPQIFRTLASKMSIDQEYKWKTMTQFRVLQAKGNTQFLERLMKDGYVDYSVPNLFTKDKKSVENFVKRYPSAKKHVNAQGTMDILFKKFKTPSGKIEIFSQKVEDEFPGYGVPAIDDMDVFNGYEYVLTSGKTSIHTNGHTTNIPYLNMLMSDNPVWINPVTAKKENLKEGDIIYLENDVSKEKATVLITEGIRPDTIFAYMGFGRESKKLKRANNKGLSTSKLLPQIKGPVCSTMITNTGVKITKA